MKSIYLVLLFVFAVAMVGCQDDVGSPDTDKENKDSSKEVVGKSKTDPKSSPTKVDSSKEIVIDVRSQEEWDSGHLDQAVHIPHTEIAERIEEVTSDKSAKLVLY